MAPSTAIGLVALIQAIVRCTHHPKPTALGIPIADTTSPTKHARAPLARSARDSFDGLYIFQLAVWVFCC